MDEEKLKAALAAHNERLERALSEMGAAVAAGMRDAAKIAEDGPRERWRQNLAASVQLTILKENLKYGRPIDPDEIAHEAVVHADAMIAAIEKKA
jgi:hypothetical protein